MKCEKGAAKMRKTSKKDKVVLSIAYVPYLILENHMSSWHIAFHSCWRHEPVADCRHDNSWTNPCAKACLQPFDHFQLSSKRVAGKALKGFVTMSEVHVLTRDREDAGKCSKCQLRFNTRKYEHKLIAK